MSFECSLCEKESEITVPMYSDDGKRYICKSCFLTLKGLREFSFVNISKKNKEFKSRENNTKEKVFEFEFYDILFRLLDVVEAFDNGKRKALLSKDYGELLNKLRWCYKTLKKNINWFEGD